MYCILRAAQERVAVVRWTGVCLDAELCQAPAPSPPHPKLWARNKKKACLSTALPCFLPSPGIVRLEATLVALHDVEATGNLEPGDDYQPSISSSPVLTPARRGAATPAGSRAAAQQAKRLDAGSWNMLSALAGGAQQTRRGGEKEGSSGQEDAARRPKPQAPAPGPNTQDPAPRPGHADRHAEGARPAPPPAAGVFGSGKVAPAVQRAKGTAPRARPPIAPVRAAPRADQRAPRAPVAGGDPAPAATVRPPAPAVPSLADEQQAQRMTVGDDLSDALMAASLDLPPAVRLK